MKIKKYLIVLSQKTIYTKKICFVGLQIYLLINLYTINVTFNLLLRLKILIFNIYLIQKKKNVGLMNKIRMLRKVYKKKSSKRASFQLLRFFFDEPHVIGN